MFASRFILDRVQRVCKGAFNILVLVILSAYSNRSKVSLLGARTAAGEVSLRHHALIMSSGRIPWGWASPIPVAFLKELRIMPDVIRHQVRSEFTKIQRLQQAVFDISISFLQVSHWMYCV